MITESVVDVALSEIGIDPKLQPREAIDARRVDQYAAAMAAGDAFPPVIVYRTTDRFGWLILAHGYHRCAAARQAGRTTIAAVIRDGTYDDARWEAAGSNKEWDVMGLPRGECDKRRAVRMAWIARPLAKQREIADQVGCGQQYVSRLIKEWTSHQYHSSGPEFHTTEHDGDSGGDDGAIELVPRLSEESRRAYLEQERAGWEAQMAYRNWQKAVKDIGVLLYSIEKQGGVAVLTDRWAADQVALLKAAVAELRSQFEDLEHAIEERLSAGDRLGDGAAVR